MSERIIGICRAMCPEKERIMRERENLLHVFEIDERTRNTKMPKADEAKIVKCFSRPAAGRSMLDPSELRIQPTLKLTIFYLFTKIATRADKKWTFIYEFIFDRLRAIRQDLVIQRIDPQGTIELLEPIVRFHVYAAQRLCTQSISAFDPKINNQHLLECLKHLLVCYDERSKMGPDNSDIDVALENLTLSDNRSQMEAIYLLFNLGDVTSLTRGLTLPQKYRQSPEVKLAMQISLSVYLNNYVRGCRLINNLSPLLRCAAFCSLRKIRRDALQIMSEGYNNRTLTFPGMKLQKILLYRNISQIEIDCRLFNLVFTNGNILFEKQNFKKAEKLANPEMLFDEDELHRLLPYILLD